jgi:hypothetical protein
VLNHLEHFKHTKQYINTICFSRVAIFGLPVNEGRQCTCAKSRPQSCDSNVCKLYLPSEYALYIQLQLFHFPFLFFFIH